MPVDENLRTGVGAALLTLPTARTGKALVAGARAIGAALLIAVGVIHLLLAPTYTQAAAYVGALFYVTSATAWLSALAILVGVRGAWMVGGAMCAGAFGALFVSATIGLPGFTDSLSAPWAVLSLVVEAAFVLLFVVAAILRRNLLLELHDRPADLPTRRRDRQASEGPS